jgi:hypothetical protein
MIGLIVSFKHYIRLLWVLVTWQQPKETTASRMFSHVSKTMRLLLPSLPPLIFRIQLHTTHCIIASSSLGPHASSRAYTCVLHRRLYRKLACSLPAGPCSAGLEALHARICTYGRYCSSTGTRHPPDGAFRCHVLSAIVVTQVAV